MPVVMAYLWGMPISKSFVLPEGKAIYFASDLHLGAPDAPTSKQREQRFCAWLESIAADATALYLVGDVFDFWFEYRHAVPKGYVRLLGQLAALSDQGLQLHVFTGNHDLWMADYLAKELGAVIHHGPVVHQWNQQRIYIAHGDGLGPGDRTYKALKRAFTNPLLRWLFRCIHPDIGIPFASRWSQSSRKRSGHLDNRFMPVNQEPLFVHSAAIHGATQADVYVYGHRHKPMESQSEGWHFVNLGDWLCHDSYGRLDKDGMVLTMPDKA